MSSVRPSQARSPAGVPVAPRPARRGGWATGVVAAVAVLVHLVLATSMLLARPDYSWHRFRGYFPFDQTSYLAIVVDGSRGDYSFTEPFTGQGVDYYPHAYYLALGLVAQVTGGSPVLVWQVGGLVVQSLLVAVLALVTIRASGRRWAGLLAPLPFVVGTFSSLTGHSWYTALNEHAVLWGAYGVLFTLNGESVSLCLGAMALVALLLVADSRIAPHRSMLLALVACFVLGALSAVQTYSFLTAVYLGAYVAAALALVRARSRVVSVVGGILSLALLGVLPLIGPALSSASGPLTVLVSGLLPAVPGLLVLLGQLRSRLVACGVAVAVGAAPQVAWTVHGVAAKDPFLLYRQSSSTTAHLGVGTGPAFLAATAPLLVLVLLLVAGVVGRRALWIAVPAGAIPAWAVLAANDRWGADQEPYRLWIDGFALVVITVLPLAAQAGVELVSGRGVQRPASLRVGGASLRVGGASPVGGASRLGGASRVGRVVSAVAVVAVLGVVGASLGDYAGFWRYGRSGITMIDYYTSQGDAVAALAGPGSPLAGERGLRLPDPCLDPFLVKTRAQLATAFYNYGMAWPDHQGAMGRLMAARTAGTLDLADARVMGVSIVLTDSTCAANWPAANASSLRHLAGRTYTTSTGASARVDAWRLAPATS